MSSNLLSYLQESQSSQNNYRVLLERLAHPRLSGDFQNFKHCDCCYKNFHKALGLVEDLQLLLKANWSSKITRQVYIDNENLLTRALATTDSNMLMAEKLIGKIIMSHDNLNLNLHSTCPGCLQIPGYHSVRVIGFDLLQRPVIFLSIREEYQVASTRDLVHLFLLHFTLTLKEAEKLIPENQHGMGIFIDCYNLDARLISATHVEELSRVIEMFPCRIAYAIIHNLGVTARIMLNSLLYLTTVRDQVIITPSEMNNSNLEDFLTSIFPVDTVEWLVTFSDYRNTQEHMDFWFEHPSQYSDHSQGDSRGTRRYVDKFIKQQTNGHKPHPSILTTWAAEDVTETINYLEHTD